MTELKYPLFDGERIWEGAVVTVESGVITAVRECDPAECSPGLLLPGLIDAHVHMVESAQISALLRSGIAAVCDVSAPAELAETSRQLTLVRSGGMAMGIVLDPRGYVEKAAASGAQYIKVLLFNTLSIGGPALRGIVRAAHERGLKVAVHATEVATVRQAVEAGADILLHVPMKESFPPALAETIAEKGIAVAPTLVMMAAFAQSGRNGYKTADYENAEQAVRLLHGCGVPILAATDANVGSFAPAVGYGDTLHEELALLVKAGLTPVEALRAATSASAAAFGLSAGRIAAGQEATMLLVDGRPDRTIADSRRIRRFWVKGEELL